MNWPWSRHKDREQHASPDVERASAEVFGRVEAIANALERLIEDRERALMERDQNGG